jgi:hypothetical protein
MAAKKKVTVEVDINAVKKLIEAAEALTELAVAYQTGSDDPAVKALGKKKAKKK